MTPDVERWLKTVSWAVDCSPTPEPRLAGQEALGYLRRHIAAQDMLLEAPKPKLPDPGRKKIGLFRPESPETQRAAAIAVYPNSGTMSLKVLDTVDAHDGLCDEQGEDLTGMLHQTWSARRNELVRDGWLEDSGRTHRNRSGDQAIIWVLTERARRERV